MIDHHWHVLPVTYKYQLSILLMRIGRRPENCFSESGFLIKLSRTLSEVLYMTREEPIGKHISNKRYRKSHKDEIRAYQATYYKVHKARLNANRTHRDHIRRIHRPASKTKQCSVYLGIIIAEKVLSRFFDNMIKMPYNNPGYDFICGKGFKIDCKSSCLCYDKRKPNRAYWHFTIKRNEIADYFLCLAFDNRDSLEPQHIWLIPGKWISNQVGLNITNKPKPIAKWSKCEKPLDRVIACCDAIKSNG